MDPPGFPRNIPEIIDFWDKTSSIEAAGKDLEFRDRPDPSHCPEFRPGSAGAAFSKLFFLG